MIQRSIKEIEISENPKIPHRVILDDGSELTGFAKAEFRSEIDDFEKIILTFLKKGDKTL